MFVSWSKRRVGICCGWVLAAGAVIPSASRADFLVAYDHPTASSGEDIALINASTGAHVALPPSVNTSASEFAPTLDQSGAILSFERRTLLAGGPETPLRFERRAVVVNLRTGAVVSNSLVSTTAELMPSLDPTGRALAFSSYGDGDVYRDSAELRGVFTSFDRPLASGFDVPTYNCFFGCSEALGVKVLQAAASGGSQPVVTWARELYQPRGDTFPFGTPLPSRVLIGTEIVAHRLASAFGGAYVANADAQNIARGIFEGPGGQGGINPDPSPALFSDPAPSPSGLIAFERRRITSTGTPAPADVAFLDLNTGDVNADPLAGVTSPLDERFPVWSDDGRYLAFLRHSPDDHDRLVIFDFFTQQPLNSVQFDLGVIPDATGALRRQISSIGFAHPAPPPTIVCDASCQSFITSTQVKGGSSIGYLVQHVVGKHRVAGRRVPRLRAVGRVPLGFRRHRFRVAASLVVAALHLKDGTYQIVARTLAGSAKKPRVRDLSIPLRIVFRRGKIRSAARVTAASIGG